MTIIIFASSGWLVCDDAVDVHSKKNVQDTKIQMRRREIDVIVIDNDDNVEDFSCDNDPTRGYGQLLVNENLPSNLHAQKKSFS